MMGDKQDNPIRIGLDAKRIVRNATGLGSYGRTLAADLARHNRFDLLLYAPDAGHDNLRSQLAETANLHYRFSNAQTALGKALWRSRGIVGQLQRDGVRLFHGLSGELPTGIHRSGIKTVVTIHDLIFLRHPEYYKWIDTKLYAWKFWRTLKEADRIIAISECTRRDIMEFGNVPAEKISLIYQSCSTFFKQQESEDLLQKVNARYELPSRYIVNVGTIEERKNIALAVKALPLLPPDLHLVVVGRRTPYTDSVLQQAADLQVSQRVHILTGVPNSDLPSIYQMAEACVYPSRYEGFGIPIIEAVQSGLPVVACTGSCLEEAGGPDNLYVSPDDVEGMAAAIRQSLKGAEGRDERILRSQEYVRRFEGVDVAGQVLSLYKELLNS